MTNELKPCPLCGCHGVTMRSNPLNKKEHTIKCEDCPAGAQFFSSTADQAIDAWNRRPDTRAMGASAVTDSVYTKLKELIQMQSEGEWTDSMVESDARHFTAALMPILAQPESPAASTQDGAVDIADFAELIDVYQCAQKDGSIDERARARIALLNAYRAASQPSAKALTDEQIDAIAAPFLMLGDGDNEHDSIDWRGFARVLLAAQPSEDKRDLYAAGWMQCAK